MTEIKITYESLFDLLRKERNREEIQTLDPSFASDVLAYLAQKQAAAEGGHSAEAEKARIQLQNVRRILKELYDRREKKTLTLALNTVRTGAQLADRQRLLPEEQVLCNELVHLLARQRADFLHPLLRQATPYGPAGDFENDRSLLATQELATRAPMMDDRPASPQPPVLSTRPTPTTPPPLPPEKPSSKPSEGRILVRFTHAVPRFSGGDEQVFGPFAPGDQADLPGKIADVLVRKGRAELC